MLSTVRLRGQIWCPRRRTVVPQEPQRAVSTARMIHATTPCSAFFALVWTIFAPGTSPFQGACAIFLRVFAFIPTSPRQHAANRALLFSLCALGTAAHAQDAAPSTVVDSAPTNSTAQATSEKSNSPARLELRAGSVTYAGQRAIVEAEPNGFVEIEGGGSLVRARRVEIDLAKRTLQATGEVSFTREVVAERKIYTPERSRDSSFLIGPDVGGRSRVGRLSREEDFTETVRGEDLNFNTLSKKGRVDNAELRTQGFDLNANRIELDGPVYSARGVVLRPGGLSDEERKIYGTPPFTLRARLLKVTRREDGTRRITARGAGLYYKSTRLLPIPALIVPQLVRVGPSRANAPYRVLPRIGFNASDGFLFTSRLAFPIASLSRSAVVENTTAENATSQTAAQAASQTRAPIDTTFYTDIGLSAKRGFRGGVALENLSPLGFAAARLRKTDIVTTQLTNRIELDRTPEVQFDSSIVPLLRAGARRGLGFYTSLNAGRYDESLIGIDGYHVRGSRAQGVVALTTRVQDSDGFYGDVFLSQTRYNSVKGTTPLALPGSDRSYHNTGFEIGYAGNLSPRVRGLFSVRINNVSGQTPFRFDRVEIPRELRTTFDVQVTPRYIVPLDFRYDLDENTVRDTTYGVLRSYKNFAYGVTYQTARRDLNLEFRSQF